MLTTSFEEAETVPALAHYTSFDAFTSILKSKEIWLSVIKEMNDTSEMIRGTEIVSSALDALGPTLFNSLPFGSMNVPDQFAARRAILEHETFAFCLSIHGADAQTDRLVMWRAYGQNGDGLCLVMRKETLLEQRSSDGLFPLHWARITYEGEAAARDRVRRTLAHIDNILRSRPNQLAVVPPTLVGMLVANAAAILAASHKHPAFSEEREVRFIHSKIFAASVSSDWGTRTVDLGERPALKFVLPLRNYAEFGINASLPVLLDHVIVGPSPNQHDKMLEVRSILDAHDLQEVGVVCSQIPYRAPPRSGK
jgi:hypothetical protein